MKILGSVPKVQMLLGGGGKTYAQKMLGLGPIAYWRVIETSGTAAVCSVNAAQNGTFARDISTMGTIAGPIAGETAPVFDGTNDYLDIGTLTFRLAFDTPAKADGSISFWDKVSAPFWTEGVGRNFWFLKDDANNYLQKYKHPNNNYLRHELRMGGTSQYVNLSSESDTTWVNWIWSWSISGDYFKVYKNGIQVGTTQTGLGVWDGPLSTLYTLIGAILKSPINSPLLGSVSNYAVFSKVLSESERGVCANP